MTENKTKVKDLAAELGVTTKELGQVLKDMNISAKTSTSVIAQEDLPRIKERVQAQRDGGARKEGNPDVIVRRRHRDGDRASARAEAKAPEQEATAAMPETSAPERAEEADKPAVAKPAKAPETEAHARARKEPQAEPVKARIIRRPDEPAPVAKVVEAAPAETPAPEAPAVKATVTAEAAPAKTVEPESERPQADKPATARVVRPATPDASAVPDGTSSAPTLPVRSAEPSDTVERADADADGDDDDAQQRRRKKKRRQPEAVVPQVRVISRPDPAAVAQQQMQQQAAQQQREAGGYRPGGQRPEGGYRPEGQREGGYRPEGQREGGYRPGGAPRPEGGYRPGGPRPEGGYRPGAPRPEGGYRPAGGPRPEGQREGGYRPGAPRPEGGYRPAGGAPRPEGQREGGYRPAGGPPRPGGAPRPGGFGGAPGGMPVPGADGRGDQSKKKRQKGRRTVDFQADGPRGRSDDDVMRGPRGRGKRGKKDVRPAATQPLKAIKRKIKVDEAIRVADMAHQMGLKANEIIKVLFGLGVMATINQSLDIDTATVVAGEFGYEVEKVGFSEDDYLVPKEEDAPETLVTRPPVVTIMGHVDHGKTSLLDAIRKSNVTAGEAGGITQHIGAYHVTTKKGEIVFLDTPGHEAFTAMRARGAQITDLVVLVVAADDGVMEQTREAVNHSKAAGVPIMVAVNKMDKEGANPDRVIRELSELGLVAEDWGGDTIFAKVSAKTREGLDELLELIAIQAEILELKANPDKAARGHVVEAKLDKGRGPLATVLVQEGTLRQGDAFVCGVFAGRVRAMFDDQGRKVKEAGPSTPVEVQGFDGVVEAGEEFVSVADDKVARRIAESRAVKQRERELAKESKVTLETFLSRRADAAEALTLNLVLKADVQGTLEAISEAVRKLSTEKVKINIIHGGAGAITESDILLASASDAIIIGFNVRPTSKVKDIAEQENVDIRFYDIIYKLVDEIKSAMAGMLAPVQREVYLGQAEVRETFSVPKIGVIAGCHVADGKVTRNAGVRLLRDGVVVYTGKITSLKRFKDDVRDVQKGYECGMGLENFNDIKVGDVIEAFEMVEEAATL
ncbi:translation initiation factor IF-2 [Nitratidesulfovibrio vulgaris]|uniref:Translation initiation factor IF-2 n=1 Tax=Nitratidesulfovibrio vulgaris (strain DP4) TaxID=391774 RepID=IF2_NITV4|nr:translation initiation factor IF-2 [Nitratidesulfovibrio vulgaris]A1VG83.1 RecName: Full=Translation initiation factor IF-2 [Nitratidesulfovibrio vulgaris DP4]ABM29449.1 bacterial translation initiation factor 2 (bIF-2) [Nitratidesulfovibrio vulgaris DP4]GEB80693.1 translation initiation factor IF-2 [Desulfovibrio desulfuricans]